MDEAKERHAEEVSDWKETSRKNANCLIINVNVAKTHSAKMSVELNLILVRFEKHDSALQTLVNANMERKVMSVDTMAKIWIYFRVAVQSSDRSTL